jgi:predicted RNase H-like HicB family nuclease
MAKHFYIKRNDIQYEIKITRAGKNGWNAYIPDLPGCVACAFSEEEVRKLIVEAIDLHLGDF